MYQYPGMRRRLPNRIGGCITGIVILLLLVGGLGFLVSRAHNGATIAVSAHPTLIANSCNGPVIIQAGPANQMTFAGIFPQYSQNSATNTVEITQCDAGTTITVPPETDIQVDTNDAITVLGVSGVLNLSANGSRITLEGVTLQGQSKIDDNGGAIVFTGNIAQDNTSTFSDNSGSIDITLPASLSFHLNLTGILGPIASNFSGVQNPASDTSSATFDIGSNPETTKLTLDLNDTALILNKGV
jgi:hypothetical protein